MDHSNGLGYTTHGRLLPWGGRLETYGDYISHGRRLVNVDAGSENNDVNVTPWSVSHVDNDDGSNDDALQNIPVKLVT